MICFWGSKVKITASRRGAEGVHVDSVATRSIVYIVIIVIVIIIVIIRPHRL